MDERLAELLDELRRFTLSGPGDRPDNYQRNLPEAQRLAQVPLVHGSDRISDLEAIAAEGALLSRTQRGKRPSQAEAYLGIKDVVYAAAGILYPDARVAFVFRPRIEEPDDTMASPWDSGAVCGSLCPTLPPRPAPERRRLFERYSLPAPDYREYLVCYVASCYRSWWHYLNLRNRHGFTSPCGGLSERPRSRSFEVRVPRQIPVNEQTLLAVFISQQDHLLPSAVTDWLGRMKRSGIEIEYCSGSARSLQARVCEWIQRHLGSRR